MTDTSTTKYYINGRPWQAPTPDTSTNPIDTSTTKYYLNGRPWQYPYTQTQSGGVTTKPRMILVKMIGI